MTKRPSYKVYPIIFTVEDRGEFPFDMRYDSCFPSTQNDVSMLNKQYKHIPKYDTVRSISWYINTFGWVVIDDGLT